VHATQHLLEVAELNCYTVVWNGCTIQQVVKVLVAAGANLAARDTAHGSTPLIWACGGGHFAVIKYLLDEGQ
jgi:ankyrin repeat protein